MTDEIFGEKPKKPKSKAPPMRNNAPDDFQTPPFAVKYLFPYLKRQWRIWECAAGKGNIVRTLEKDGFNVFGTDIKTGFDFIRKEASVEFDAIVTNPPYSIKDNWLKKCFGYQKPFALLMPLAALGEQDRTAMFAEHGIEILMPPIRINYETPSGEGSGAQFFSAWFCWKMNLPQQITFIRKNDHKQGKLF